MAENRPTDRPRLRLALAALTLALLTAAALAAAGVDQARGGAAKVLGETKKTPKPLCPKNCAGTGSVTGYQVKADGRSSLFKVPADGHIVGWSVRLSKPDESQIAGFGDLFEDEKYGKDPYARIAVLKKVKAGRLKLTKQSPVVPLLPRLGQQPIYTLEKPLRAKKGTIVALTIPTWAPLYKDGLEGSENKWVASRNPNKCSGRTEEVTGAKPHQRKGQTRTYGCRFSGERILYWAYFSPAKKDKGGK